MVAPRRPAPGHCPKWTARPALERRKGNGTVALGSPGHLARGAPKEPGPRHSEPRNGFYSTASKTKGASRKNFPGCTFRCSLGSPRASGETPGPVGRRASKAETPEAGWVGIERQGCSQRVTAHVLGDSLAAGWTEWHDRRVLDWPEPRTSPSCVTFPRPPSAAGPIRLRSGALRGRSTMSTILDHVDDRLGELTECIDGQRELVTKIGRASCRERVCLVV